MPAILDLLQQDRISVKKVASTHGGEYQGPCPLCGGVDRFRVWPEEKTGKWWCRGCNHGGDLVQYFREVRKMSYREACLEAGVEPAPMKKTFDWSEKSNLRKWTPREISFPPEIWIQKCQAFVEYAQEQLWNCPPVLQYLAQKRGLDDGTIETMGLGYNPQNLNRERSFWGLEEKSKKDGSKQDIWLPRGIVIPCFSDGALQRARIRRIDRQGNNPVSGPPYCIVSGSTSAPMIMGECSQVVTVVESEFDAILLRQEIEGLGGVVALGSASARPDKRCTDILKASKLILVALDSDDQPGKENTGAKQAQWWTEHFEQARRLPPIDGKDPGEMWANGVDLQQWVAVGINKYYPGAYSEKNKNGTLLDNSQVDRTVTPELLEKIHWKEVEKLIPVYPAGCFEWINSHKPDLAQSNEESEQWLNEVWDLCEEGAASLEDFQSALSMWADGQREEIEAYKEGCCE